MVKILGRLLGLSVIIGMVIFALAFAYHRHWLKTDYLQYVGLNANDFFNERGQITLQGMKVNVKDADWHNLGKDGVNQVKILGEKALETGKQAQGFVQQAVKVDENSQQSLSDKAFDYGRYVYCQQVVTEYEKNQAATPTATVAPTHD